jgi:hypothetical protein
MAQLVAHHTGSVGVRGSNPLSSTHRNPLPPAQVRSSSAAIKIDVTVPPWAAMTSATIADPEPAPPPWPDPWPTTFGYYEFVHACTAFAVTANTCFVVRGLLKPVSAQHPGGLRDRLVER